MHTARVGILVMAGLCGAATAQPPGWRSTLQDYRPFTDEAVISWKQANEAVREAGGWRAYAKEAQAPAPTKDGKAEGSGGHKH